MLSAFLGVSSALANPALTFAPVLMGAFVIHGFTAKQAVALISAELIATALAAIPALIWGVKYQWRDTAVFFLVMLALGNFVSAFCESYFVLLVMRVFTGGIEGILLILFLLIIGERRGPEKVFSGKLAVQMMTAALGLAVFPVLSGLWGLKSIYFTLGIASILLILGRSALPARSHKKREEDVKFSTRKNVLGAVCLLLLLIFGAAAGLIWIFLERIGTYWSIPLEILGAGLSLATLMTIFVSLLCAKLGTQFGRLLPLSLALLLGVAGCLMLSLQSEGLVIFVFGAIFIGIARTIPIPYLFGSLAVVDQSKRFTILSHVALSIGLGLGPIFGLGLSDQALFGVEYLSAFLMIVVLITSIWLMQAIDKVESTSS